MSIQIKLTDDEVFKAIFQYVEKNYPNMYGTQATVHTNRGLVEGATVECKYVKASREPDMNGRNPFEPSKPKPSRVEKWW